PRAAPAPPSAESEAPAQAHPTPSPARARAPRSASRVAQPARRDPAVRAESARALAGLGLLSVRAVPWARVVIDGRQVGTSPLANMPLPEGEHTLTLVPG